MGYSYDDVGKFGDAAAAEAWARRNNIDPRDLHIRNTPDGVEAGVRKNTRANDRYDDGHGDRRDGFNR